MFEAVRLLIDGITGGSNGYRRTVKELNRMTDRELADIGVSRCDIPRVAKEGVIR